MTMYCRNCNSLDCHSLATGVVAPFFLKRVFGINLSDLAGVLTVNNNAQLIEHIRTNNLEFLFPYKSPVLAVLRVCKRCGFVGPEMYYPEEMLAHLYTDYRSDSYNEERCRYEPQYKDVQYLVGKDPVEISVRLANLEQLLKSELELDGIHSVLDWGGGEGRFIPPCLKNKDVYILDISDEPLKDTNFTRISQPSSGQLFDLILVAHVIEHVSSPLEFMKKVLLHLKPGGFLYIEVPQDQPDENIQLFKFSPASINHWIHEHLNLYCEASLMHLGDALGAHRVTMKKNMVDLGWIKGTHLAGIFQKRV